MKQEYIIIYEPTEHLPWITENGSKIIQKIKNIFSDEKYKLPKTININWLTNDKFEAYASINLDDNNKHNINISYGVPISIIKHAAEFTYICKNIYSKENYNLTFAKLNFNNGKIRYVLPKDLTKYITTQTLLEYSLSWLYLHEQAHLFQSHGSIFSQLAENQESSFNVTWHENSITDMNEYRSLSEHDRYLKHALELSADYEATYLIIELLKKSKIIKCSSLWILIAGLTYLFHTFYVTKKEYRDEIVSGTHPNPAIRIRMIYIQLLTTFKDPNIKEYFEKNKTSNNYIETMEHAFFTAMLYCGQDDTKFTNMEEFMDRIFDYNSASNKKYISSTKRVWRKTRPYVVKEYFGHSEKTILPNFK